MSIYLCKLQKVWYVHIWAKCDTCFSASCLQWIPFCSGLKDEYFERISSSKTMMLWLGKEWNTVCSGSWSLFLGSVGISAECSQLWRSHRAWCFSLVFLRPERRASPLTRWKTKWCTEGYLSCGMWLSEKARSIDPSCLTSLKGMHFMPWENDKHS